MKVFFITFDLLGYLNSSDRKMNEDCLSKQTAISLLLTFRTNLLKFANQCKHLEKEGYITALTIV